MNKIKEDILNKIKKGEIEKTSLWFFVVKDYLFWFLFAFSILIGSVAFSSVLVQMLFDIPDFDTAVRGGVPYFFISVPYIWILILVLFSFVAWFNFKHTKRAYKKHNILIVLMSVLISIILGSLMFVTGLGDVLEDGAKRYVPVYRQHVREGLDRKIEFMKRKGIDTKRHEMRMRVFQNTEPPFDKKVMIYKEQRPQ